MPRYFLFVSYFVVLGSTVLQIMKTSLCNLALSVSASSSSLLYLKLFQFLIAGSSLVNVTSSQYSNRANHALFDVTHTIVKPSIFLPPCSSLFGFKLSCSAHRPQHLYIVGLYVTIVKVSRYLFSSRANGHCMKDSSSSICSSLHRPLLRGRYCHVSRLCLRRSSRNSNVSSFIRY